MQIQADYETDVTLAVFRTMAQLEAAVQQLVHAGLHPDALDRQDLAPGRYELVDTTPSEEVSGAVRGIGIGLPAGAAVGGVAASFFGAPPEILAAAASAGAVAGGLLGAFEG